MEISGNKYLHKKFKKQTSCAYNAVEETKHEKTSNTFTTSQSETETTTQKTEEKSSPNSDNSDDINNRLYRTNNRELLENVPNLKSTNCEYIEKNNLIIKLNNNESSISQKIIINDYDNTDNANLRTVSNNFISKIDVPNLVNNYELKENHFNFDIKTSSNTQNYEKSSDIVYSKYLLSERQPNNANVLNDDKTYPKSEENSLSNQETVESKKESSGGKYVCTYCNLACSKPSVLQKHIRAHTNERPYPCVSCRFSFKTRSNLYKHCRSRTHANRVMGNKHLQDNNLPIIENDSQEKYDRFDSDNSQEKTYRTNPEPIQNQTIESYDQKNWEQKSKPYKPKFHTAKLFFEENKLDVEKKNEEPNKTQELKLRINELIHKNNSIVNSDEAVFIRRKNIENGYDQPEPSYEAIKADEPLNLSSKSRKRCLSDSENTHGTDKSLIKQLLLKNLNPDPDLQCGYCKMIFQSVPELEMHKFKYCSVYNKGNSAVRYSRSSSVNVASILTQNKNAFDNLPPLQNPNFPLKSPGPFLGKTRLINESDKAERYRTFSFDDNAIMNPPESPMSKYMLSPGFSPISPLKKNSVKLFGGEVKITQTSGETRSFKIESETSLSKNNNEITNYDEYNSKLSENLVVKSSLGSGGTVLQRPTYTQKNINLPSPNIIRYETSNVSNLNIPILNKPQEMLLAPVPQRKSPINRDHVDEIDVFKSNLIDFSQKAMKLITPNLKAPNLIIPGLPIPNDLIEKDKHHLDNINFAKKQITLQQKMAEPLTPTNILNPVNLYVDGKVVRYVPGMPGPVESAELPPKVIKSVPKTPTMNGKVATPTIVIEPELNDIKMQVISKIKSMDFERKKELEKDKNLLSPEKKNEEVKKFVRPNSLALKPSSTFKQHHGLTPTMFNQALISPDTPRVAKKFVQQYLNGNYFSYLGLKSSTKSVYCTLNKTQPFYVKHFKKLSMYSEWRQQESKIDSLSVSSYDSRQRPCRYTMAGSSKADLIVHSSYKFVISELPKSDSESLKNAVLGGYESNEDYTYIRGRGRGRYVCDQCGIRCKKPSMLKKHLRTHSDDRPYTCEHCNFSFKTKGNLTKHMKSKAHTKKFTETSTSSVVTSDSESDDSDAECSDESTRLQEQEHEAAHCLLSLAQKGTPPPISEKSPSSFNLNEYPIIKDDNFLKNSDQITQVHNTNFAKNKILDESNLNFNSKQINSDAFEAVTTEEENNYSQYLGKSSTIRPLTYPYQRNIDEKDNFETSPKSYEANSVIKVAEPRQAEEVRKEEFNVEGNLPASVLIRKRKLSGGTIVQNKVSRPEDGPKPINLSSTIVINDSPVLDLSSPVTEYRESRNENRDRIYSERSQFLAIPKSDDLQMEFFKQRNNSFSSTKSEQDVYPYDSHSPLQKHRTSSFPGISKPYDENNDQNSYQFPSKSRHSSFSESNSSETFSQMSEHDRKDESIDNPNVIYKSVNFGEPNISELNQDQSAMQTLADIAIKQMKNEKNILAKNVASVYLKLTTKNENENSEGAKKFNVNTNKDNGDNLIVKSEENKNCTICLKNFSKPSQLRLHMNIHYLERPYRCESCSVSFRTKGHLQKHERSASHHNKLSSSPALSSSEPRPFKCSDCNIAFRIHGHLAKHLRSKMHIMKLECLAKIPFGLYAELERANSLLTEINTHDGEQCLESLKILARKLFSNDPNKMDQISTVQENRDS